MRRLPELAPALARPLVVGPMAWRNCARPSSNRATLAQLTLEAGLAERILEDLGATCAEDGVFPTVSSDPGGVLPLLPHTLLTTWKHREGQQLTLAGHQATGGVSRRRPTPPMPVSAGWDWPTATAPGGC
ncbi:hypothetical protein [Nonomuraea sp. NPDC052265]|uniref:nSTAND1 domain-containing NTPase n=1 Tax=Nonomuraea sp. NPDC052265 TaxID=3364374 RepID=UPI0037C81F73